MSTAAAKKFALKALQLFPPYRWDDQMEADWIEDVMRQTAHFGDDVIERATTEMIQTRKRKDGTPAISEAIRYCAEAKRWMEAETNKGKLPFSSAPEPFMDDWRKDEFANELALNPRDRLCVQAAKEEWIGMLHYFVRHHRRMPSANQRMEYLPSAHTKRGEGETVSEIDWCKREAAAASAAARLVFSGKHVHSDAYAWAEDVLKRRQEKADCVLHGLDWRKAA